MWVHCNLKEGEKNKKYAQRRTHGGHKTKIEILFCQLVEKYNRTIDHSGCKGGIKEINFTFP